MAIGFVGEKKKNKEKCLQKCKTSVKKYTREIHFYYSLAVSILTAYFLN